MAGELVIFAPHVETFSDSHAQVIERVGYHVRDYFLAGWERYKNEPRMVLAHCIVVKGEGTYSNGIESPRIRVTLASLIPAEKCRRAGLEYATRRKSPAYCARRACRRIHSWSRMREKPCFSPGNTHGISQRKASHQMRHDYST